MASPKVVLGISFILLRAGFRETHRAVPKCARAGMPGISPAAATHPCEFRGDQAHIPLLSTSRLLSILP
jgi:hypothetical protein